MKKFNKSKVLNSLFNEYNVKTRSELVSAIENSNKSHKVKINHINKALKCSSGKVRIENNLNRIKDIELLCKNYNVNDKNDLVKAINNNKDKKSKTKLTHINKLNKYEKSYDKDMKKDLDNLKDEVKEKVKNNDLVKERLKKKYNVTKMSDLRKEVEKRMIKSNEKRIIRKDIPREKAKFTYRNYDSYIDIKVNAKDTDGNKIFTIGLNEKQTKEYNSKKDNLEKYKFIDDLFFGQTTANRYLELDEGAEFYHLMDILRVRD